MTDALTAISQAMSADLDQMRTVSQNVTNANTPGYRAMVLAPAQGPAHSGSPGAVTMQTFVSAAQGPAISTGRSLDFSLSGNAYFCVQTAQGVSYTRDGNFHLDNAGQLVTAKGYKVLGSDGPITLPSASVKVDTAGHISWKDKVRAQFALVSMPSTARLETAGDGIYRITASSGAGDPAPALATPSIASYSLHQGSLEGANVATSDEALRLIEISRHMESVQRAILTYDQILNSGINDLGNK